MGAKLKLHPILPVKPFASRGLRLSCHLAFWLQRTVGDKVIVVTLSGTWRRYWECPA